MASTWKRLTTVGVAALAIAGCRSPVTGGSATAPSAPPTTIACANPSPGDGDARVVLAAANGFASTLDSTQRAALTHPLELGNAIRWSNYPHALIRRNGVAFGDLNAEQLQAANRLVQAAAGACGAALFRGNRGADVLGAKALPNNINPGHHFISFNGEPSASRPWMLMIGGHHLAFNYVFNGPEPGATPLFAGSDPARYVDESGVAQEPLAYQSRVLADLARAASRHPQALLPGVYTDLVRSVIPFGLTPDRFGQANDGRPTGGGGGGGGPPRDRSRMGMDFNYPLTYPTGATERGVRYTDLPVAEQALVRRAIAAYAALSGTRISAPLLQTYLQPSQLAQTYIGLSGDPNLVAPNAYVRIDGPRVWIELSVQPSLVDRSVTHFHSVWRDKSSDYGGQFKS